MKLVFIARMMEKVVNLRRDAESLSDGYNKEALVNDMSNTLNTLHRAFKDELNNYTYNTVPPLLDENEKYLANTNERIKAIKIYRDRTGLGFKESKEAYDKYMASPY